MNELERFKAVVHLEEPDYWPLVTMGGLGFVHKAGLAKLHGEGLPESVTEIESWCRYWGQCSFDRAGGLGIGAPGIKSETTVEGNFEIIRYETGAVTRQVIDNDLAYSMPDFMELTCATAPPGSATRSYARRRANATTSKTTRNGLRTARGHWSSELGGRGGSCATGWDRSAPC